MKIDGCDFTATRTVGGKSYPVVSYNRERQDLYEARRDDGMDHEQALTWLCGEDEKLLKLLDQVERENDDPQFLGWLRVYVEHVGHYRKGWENVFGDPATNARYFAIKLAGTGDRLAQMFATQTPPGAQSDTTFWAGRWDSIFAENPITAQTYKQMAVDAGVNTTGSMYLSSLARFPGDPEAWVKDRGDVKRICEERGWGCEGAVKVKRRDDVAPEPEIDVADDIVAERMQAMCASEETPLPSNHAAREALYHRAKESLLPSSGA